MSIAFISTASCQISNTFLLISSSLTIIIFKKHLFRLYIYKEIAKKWNLMAKNKLFYNALPYCTERHPHATSAYVILAWRNLPFATFVGQYIAWQVYQVNVVARRSPGLYPGYLPWRSVYRLVWNESDNYVSTNYADLSQIYTHLKYTVDVKLTHLNQASTMSDRIGRPPTSSRKGEEYSLDSIWLAYGVRQSLHSSDSSNFID